VAAVEPVPGHADDQKEKPMLSFGQNLGKYTPEVADLGRRDRRLQLPSESWAPLC
jgi:hypothetical protein